MNKKKKRKIRKFKVEKMSTHQLQYAMQEWSGRREERFDMEQIISMAEGNHDDLNREIHEYKEMDANIEAVQEEFDLRMEMTDMFYALFKNSCFFCSKPVAEIDSETKAKDGGPIISFKTNGELMFCEHHGWIHKTCAIKEQICAECEQLHSGSPCTYSGLDL